MNENQAGAVLTVRCGAVAENWKKLKQIVGKTDCAAVLKADGYGLGLQKMAEVLKNAGCRTFFVAYDFEGAQVRQVCPDARIFVLHGVFDGCEENFVHDRLIPVLATPQAVAHWRAFALKTGKTLPCAVHIDTGMSRLGLTGDEVKALKPADFDGLDVVLVMSHLARADEPDGADMSRRQLEKFKEETALLQSVVGKPFERSLSASYGIYLGPEYHFDVVRPGHALYGLMENLTPVLELKVRILQVQKAKAFQPVGYGSTDCLQKDGKLATISIGYADGYARSFSGDGVGFINGKPARVVGRVSMDLTTLDVSDFSDEELRDAKFVELIGEHADAATQAKLAKTIDYELLVHLGKRIFFRYVD